ncbi:PREDICTED: post-GPI attachment to proteins factor 2-like isoform X2 [Trachymyrmex septentrionalis]|uniref:post-GPI attachment to proteins factor 2-like isoform X2 n=1 Tax=Trachymyrmex septentrionalis TaxID=34720 RepID=UPI00084EE763|nr:PREDICTED: post-GPI attachment to proteins factor 2-like isoform X2 [Trachymyrmex septentrionalis]
MSKLRLGSEYIPLAEDDMSKARLVVPFSRVAWFTVFLPFLAFVFCVAWSVLYNFEHSTSTHCQVYNFLPSVSAAIGHYRPQKDVWKTAIALQALLRTLVFTLYYRYYKEHVYKWAEYLSNIALVMYAIENTSLVTLSFWTSNENYAYYIIKNCLNIAKGSNDASLKWKRRSMMLNVMCIVIACYFFYRHNKYCEPFVYSMFALSEYGVVLSNMGYHLTAALDFATTRLMISGNKLRII